MLVVLLSPYHDQHEAIGHIRKTGLKVGADAEGPAFLRLVFGEGYFERVVRVLPGVGYHPGDVVVVDDRDVERIAVLSDLEHLGLGDTAVTDSSLELIAKELKQLQYLGLNGTSVTDRGVEHLKGLKQLTHLQIRGTRVTAEKVHELKEAIPALRIDV